MSNGSRSLAELLPLALLAACATRSADVRPVATDPALYAALDCEALYDEADRVRLRAAQLAYVCMEMGNEISPPHRKVASIAVIKNPFAGKYVEKLDELVEIGAELGIVLTERAIKALQIEPKDIHNFGKGAIVGLDGEYEHSAAILHPKLGTPLREAVGGGKAIIPSAKKMGGPGTEIDVPLHYKDAAFVRSHFDAMSVRVPWMHPDQMRSWIVIVVTDSDRPHPRIGGLKKRRGKKRRWPEIILIASLFLFSLPTAGRR